MINNELIADYNKLDIENKRQQLNEELKRIHQLISNIEKLNNINSITRINEYNSEQYKFLSESELLTFLFQNVHSIEQEMLLLYNLLSNNKNNNI